ncbi:hypothetical protein [Bremerella sp. P1]|uniref:hypothetical protein n=1 Tax=Bremerella sp. P1 TaxID=3026424 RepID=UPI00236835EC|nr:hypothetical protein [Bremerella sp. P1]WDI41672.1 hypothetical protein PSR63_24740 [Bremerella sp. P1]
MDGIKQTIICQAAVSLNSAIEKLGQRGDNFIDSTCPWEWDGVDRQAQRDWQEIEEDENMQTPVSTSSEMRIVSRNHPPIISFTRS